MILIDANVFMYAAGVPHAHKAPSAAFLKRVARGDLDAVVDAETLREILHRYRALRRWDDGKRVFTSRAGSSPSSRRSQQKTSTPRAPCSTATPHCQRATHCTPPSTAQSARLRSARTPATSMP